VFVIGIDENGLGPRLGMFCLTASVFECKNYDPAAFRKIFGAAGVKDSKQILSSRKMEKGREIVLSFLKSLDGETPSSWDAFLRRVGFLKISEYKKKCRKNCLPLCWNNTESLEGNCALPDLKLNASAKLKEIKVLYYCPKMFNEGIKRRSTKTALEFEMLERFFSKYRALYGKNVLYICGKLGGTKKYERFFDFLRNFKLVRKAEGKNSFYEFKNFGRVEFVMDAEEKHFPVALSSVFGKVVREIFVRRMNSFFKKYIPTLKNASGYNDRITADFILKTSALRKKLKIPDDCFIRK